MTSRYCFTGKRLTAAAALFFGIRRKRRFWFFWESDASLRARCLAVLEGVR